MRLKIVGILTRRAARRLSRPINDLDGASDRHSANLGVSVGADARHLRGLRSHLGGELLRGCLGVVVPRVRGKPGRHHVRFALRDLGRFGGLDGDRVGRCLVDLVLLQRCRRHVLGRGGRVGNRRRHARGHRHVGGRVQVVLHGDAALVRPGVHRGRPNEADREKEWPDTSAAWRGHRCLEGQGCSGEPLRLHWVCTGRWWTVGSVPPSRSLVGGDSAKPFPVVPGSATRVCRNVP